MTDENLGEGYRVGILSCRSFVCVVFVFAASLQAVAQSGTKETPEEGAVKGKTMIMEGSKKMMDGAKDDARSNADDEGREGHSEGPANDDRGTR